MIWLGKAKVESPCQPVRSMLRAIRVGLLRVRKSRSSDAAPVAYSCRPWSRSLPTGSRSPEVTLRSREGMMICFFCPSGSTRRTTSPHPELSLSRIRAVTSIAEQTLWSSPLTLSRRRRSPSVSRAKPSGRPASRLLVRWPTDPGTANRSSSSSCSRPEKC